MTINLGQWKPDCGGDYVLSGNGYFANYWPDNTVLASIYLGDDEESTKIVDSDIQSFRTQTQCFEFAEGWIQERLARMAAAISDS